MAEGSDEWITVGEAAKRLGLHPDTVRRRVDDNTLRAKWTKPPASGWRRISAASVEEFRRAMHGERPDAE